MRLGGYDTFFVFCGTMVWIFGVALMCVIKGNGHIEKD